MDLQRQPRCACWQRQLERVVLGLRAAPRLSGPRGRPSLRSGVGCACAKLAAYSAPLVSRGRSVALHDGVLRELGEGVGEWGGQAGWAGARHQNLRRTPERGVARALGLEVLDGPRQQVPADELGSWTPWRKDPKGAEAGELLKGLQQETRSSGGGVNCQGSRVRRAPSHQSCSWVGWGAVLWTDKNLLSVLMSGEL